MSSQHSPRHPAPACRIGGSGGSPGAADSVVKRYDNILKSEGDKREYRGLMLSNRMKILLASDSTAETSAAALDVSVGYLSDPGELPGLAHFCEHMLFMGTRKYPEENEYSKFLSEHGGSSNAATGTDYTTFYFDVRPQHLRQTLDIFAQFFIDPLFTESATSRELNAVNSEHEKNMSSDTWRLMQIQQSIADPKHAYYKFGTGNKETLETIPKTKGIDVRTELLKFHKQWYSANIMTLVVLGKESLDELEEMVVPLFSAVVDGGVSVPSWPESPFPPALRRKLTYVVPINDVRSLSIFFPFPDTTNHYKMRPGYYLSHLLGHEGPGSLLSELKARGWCHSLCAQSDVAARGFGFFYVDVNNLTEDGLEHVDDIITLIFQYLCMVREEGPQRWIWEEHRDLLAMNFLLQDVQEPQGFVNSHVNALHRFPMDDILALGSVLTEWRPELIKALLDLLTPDNVSVGVTAKCFEEKCTQTEPWYGTKYVQEDIPESKIREWQSVKSIKELHLPPPNEFIPSNLQLETEEEADPIAPAIIKDTPLMRLWYKKDNEFKLPKAVIELDLVSPLLYSDPISSNLAMVWERLLRDSLQQVGYAALLAGLEWSVGDQACVLSVSISGYDDKQHLLLDKIMEHLFNFKADPQRFEIMKENRIRAMKNIETLQPTNHAEIQHSLCLTETEWTAGQLLNAAQGITPSQLDDFAARVLRSIHIELFMFGNLTKQRALRIADSVEGWLPKDAVPLHAVDLILNRQIKIEEGAWYQREVSNAIHKSSCALLYYECGTRGSRHNAVLALLDQTLCEQCFYVLRTKEQLGYVVSCGVWHSNGVHGFKVVVQSERHPRYVDSRIEAFLGYAQEYLENMSEEEFITHRSSLAALKLEKPKSINSRAGQLWSEINNRTYNFDRQRIEVEELNTVTKQELIDFFKKHIASSSAERQKMSVHVISTAEGGAGQTDDAICDSGTRQPVKITDLLEFKSGRHLCWRLRSQIYRALESLKDENYNVYI